MLMRREMNADRKGGGRHVGACPMERYCDAAGRGASRCMRQDERKKEAMHWQEGGAIPRDNRPKDSRCGRMPGWLPGHGRLIRRGTR